MNTTNTPTTWTHDDDLRSRLEKYKADRNLTDAALGRLLEPRFHATRVNKYLNLDKPGRTPEPDMPLVQDAVRKLLRHHARHAEFRRRLFATVVSDQVAAVTKQVVRTGQIGAVIGPAGTGKTSGAHLLARENAAAIVITLKRYAAGAHDVIRMLFDEINDPEAAKHPETAADAWDGRSSRATFVAGRLRARERVVLVDMAHRLTPAALELLCDFHDDANTPMVLLGTQDLLRVLRRDAQIWSRVGIVQTVTFSAKDADKEEAAKTDTAQKILAEFCDAAAVPALLENAVEVLDQHGHVRALRMQATLTRDLMRSTDGKRTWPECWAKAAEKLIKPGY